MNSSLVLYSIRHLFLAHSLYFNTYISPSLALILSLPSLFLSISISPSFSLFLSFPLSLALSLTHSHPLSLSLSPLSIPPLSSLSIDLSPSIYLPLSFSTYLYLLSLSLSLSFPRPISLPLSSLDLLLITTTHDSPFLSLPPSLSLSLTHHNGASLVDDDVDDIDEIVIVVDAMVEGVVRLTAYPLEFR